MYTIKTDCPKAGKNTIKVATHNEAAAVMADLLFSGRKGTTITLEIS